MKSQMILSIEHHVDLIADWLRRFSSACERGGSADAQEEWVGHVNDVAHSTLYPKAASWYMGANIPGKPRVFMPYVGV